MLVKQVREKTRKNAQAFNALSRAGSIGLHMVSGIAVGTFMGYGLDKWLDTSPWLTGVFLLFGVIAGFRNVYLDTKRLITSQENQQKNDDSTRNKN